MFAFQHHSAVLEHKARIQQPPCHRPAVQRCAVQCPFCPVVCKSQDVLLDHVLVKHRNLCRSADAEGDGNHSSVSQQPLDTATPVTDMTDVTVVDTPVTGMTDVTVVDTPVTGMTDVTVVDTPVTGMTDVTVVDTPVTGMTDVTVVDSESPVDTPVTDMTDVTVVGDVSHVLCGGPHPPHVSSQNQSASCFFSTRNTLFNSTFPEVLRSRQVHIQSGNNAKFTSTDPSQYPYMPPLCQINEMLHYIETNHIDTANIKLDYGFYSVETITLFKTFYTGKNIQDKVRMEIKWAEQQNYLMIDGVSQLDQSCLDEYLQIVLNYAETDTVSIANNRYYIEDLTFLFGECWLSNSLLMQISVMLNATFHETKTWVYYASDLQHHTDFDTQICQQFANIHDGQIIWFVPVGSNGGTCFMGSLQVSNIDGTNILLQSNHFALAVYSIEFNIVTYMLIHLHT